MTITRGDYLTKLRLEKEPWLEQIRESNGEWIEHAREIAIKISKKYGDVSADDIWDAFPPPEESDPRCMGGIWRPRAEWELLHYVPSRRPVCHKRPIAFWRFIGHQTEGTK